MIVSGSGPWTFYLLHKFTYFGAFLENCMYLHEHSLLQLEPCAPISNQEEIFFFRFFYRLNLAWLTRYFHSSYHQISKQSKPAFDHLFNTCYVRAHDVDLWNSAKQPHLDKEGMSS